MSFEEGRQYDIIFAGGGTAACVAAGRLAAADPNLSILLIERGKNNLNDPMIRSPGIYFANLIPSSTNAIFYQAETEPSLNNIPRTVSTGGVLGGGSSINAMMYTRAQARDYDSFGVEGWDWKSLLPYARKLEKIAVPEVSSLDQTVHGISGPIEISYGTHCPKEPQDDILAAAESYGYPEIHDLQDFTSVGGFNRSAKYIGRDGTRQDAAHQYIHPLIADGKHPNLHILPESKVRRVLFEGNQAVGVEYEPEPTFMLLQDKGLTTIASRTVKARKLIVISAGALGTPLILERSGIGNKELLAKHNIPLVSDLPNVGENYQDHHFLLCSYKTNLNPDDTLDGILSQRRDFVDALTSHDPILGTNALDIGAKLRMDSEEAAALGPEFKRVWDRDFKNDSTKPIMLMGTLNFFVGDHKMLNEEENGVNQYITMGSYTPYPYSRGSVHIASLDCNVPPKFITGFLADKNNIDLKKSVWAYKKARDIYRRTNAFAGEEPLGHPAFREGSQAALANGPIKKAEFHSVEERKNIPPLKYDDEDDRAIEKFIRDRISTTWHSLGTCKMAPQEKGGVVDKDLNIYGVKGLKCADMSIIPENVAANTNNTALIVGEKTADIIGKELGLLV